MRPTISVARDGAVYVAQLAAFDSNKTIAHKTTSKSDETETNLKSDDNDFAVKMLFIDTTVISNM